MHAHRVDTRMSATIRHQPLLKSLAQHSSWIRSLVSTQGCTEVTTSEKHLLPAVYVHSCPITTLPLPFAMTVDASQDTRLAVQAMLLYAEQKTALVLSGEPLFVAHLVDDLVTHQRERLLGSSSARLPAFPHVMLATSGYEMPASLERWLRRQMAALSPSVDILQLYCSAEGDGAVMIASEREARGFFSRNRLLYHATQDVHASCTKDGRLSLQVGDAAPRICAHLAAVDQRTGGLFLRDVKQLDAACHSFLDEWSDQDWTRRTGYLLYQQDSNTFQCQLREKSSTSSPSPTSPPHDGFLISEVPFADFLRLISSDSVWLHKPRWLSKPGSISYRLVNAAQTEHAGVLQRIERSHYRVYVQEFSFPSLRLSPWCDHQHALLGDHNNHSAIFFVAQSPLQSVVGSFRLNRLNEVRDPGGRDHLRWKTLRRALPEVWERGEMAHGSRAVVKAHWRGSEVFPKLAEQMLDYVLSERILLVTSLCQKPLLPLYAKLGFRQYAEAYLDAEFNSVEYPILCLPFDVEHLVRCQSPLLPTLRRRHVQQDDSIVFKPYGTLSRESPC